MNQNSSDLAYPVGHIPRAVLFFLLNLLLLIAKAPIYFPKVRAAHATVIKPSSVVVLFII